MEITELDKKIVRAMQDELPLVAEPFKLIAEEIDSTEEEVLARLRLMKEDGALRKMGACSDIERWALEPMPWVSGWCQRNGWTRWLR